MTAVTLAPKAVSNRVASIDVLRGFIMIIMALDHTRDYLHKNALFYNPMDLNTTSPELFFTRFITHFCAPGFVFLAGVSAFLSGQKKTRQQLSSFLFTRGLWFILLELTVLNFAFWFDVTFSIIQLQVMWAIGISMLVFSGLIYLPKKIILTIGLLLVFGHNTLDAIHFPAGTVSDFIWSILHEPKVIVLTATFKIIILYPVLPWIGVMALGYCFGEIYSGSIDAQQRRKILYRVGWAAITLFILLKLLNNYGDPVPWQEQSTLLFTALSFISVTKYPPSLEYLLLTLGISFLVLCWLDGKRFSFARFFTVYGRVPLFYYILHFYLIHLISVGSLLLGGTTLAQINFNNGSAGINPGQGVSLAQTYLIWLLIVAFFYPLCYWYHNFKSKKKSKIWSYL